MKKSENLLRKVPLSFEVHSNESACRKKVRLGLEQVYFDVRVRFTVDTTVHCFCVFCLPFYVSHTGELMLNFFKEVMDAIFPGC